MGVANGPVVAFVIGGAGFNGNLVIRDVEKRASAKGRDPGVGIGEDVGEDIGGVRAENRVRGAGDMLGSSLD